MTAAQAEQLATSALLELVEIVDDDAAASDMSTQVLESTDEEESSKPNRKKASPLLAGRFVKLLDILPPVPTRGTFKVEDIKSSLYFFS